MSKPYSADLRQRAIKCLATKMPLKDIATKLDISLPTVKRYSIQYKKFGHLNVKKEIKTGRPNKFTDLNKLSDFVKENSNFSIKDMANKLDCGTSTLQRTIKKMGFTFKKNRFYIKNATKKND